MSPLHLLTVYFFLFVTALAAPTKTWTATELSIKHHHGIPTPPPVFARRSNVTLASSTHAAAPPFTTYLSPGLNITPTDTTHGSVASPLHSALTHISPGLRAGINNTPHSYVVGPPQPTVTRISPGLNFTVLRTGAVVVENRCPFDIQSNIVHAPRFKGVKPEEIYGMLAQRTAASPSVGSCVQNMSMNVLGHPYMHDPDLGVSWKLARDDKPESGPVQIEWTWATKEKKVYWDLSMIDVNTNKKRSLTTPPSATLENIVVHGRLTATGSMPTPKYGRLTFAIPDKTTTGHTHTFPTLPAEMERRTIKCSPDTDTTYTGSDDSDKDGNEHCGAPVDLDSDSDSNSTTTDPSAHPFFPHTISILPLFNGRNVSESQSHAHDGTNCRPVHCDMSRGECDQAYNKWNHWWAQRDCAESVVLKVVMCSELEEAPPIIV